MEHGCKYVLALQGNVGEAVCWAFQGSSMWLPMASSLQMEEFLASWKPIRLIAPHARACKRVLVGIVKEVSLNLRDGPFLVLFVPAKYVDRLREAPRVSFQTC